MHSVSRTESSLLQKPDLSSASVPVDTGNFAFQGVWSEPGYIKSFLPAVEILVPALVAVACAALAH